MDPERIKPNHYYLKDEIELKKIQKEVRHIKNMKFLYLHMKIQVKTEPI